MDEKQQGAMLTNLGQKIGSFSGTHGKENCLVVCRIYGLTMCEWNTKTGECYAYMKNFSIGSDYVTSYCYKFSKNSKIASKRLADYKNLCQAVQRKSSDSSYEKKWI